MRYRFAWMYSTAGIETCRPDVGRPCALLGAGLNLAERGIARVLIERRCGFRPPDEVNRRNRDLGKVEWHQRHSQIADDL
jgi:hypothetical protein